MKILITGATGFIGKPLCRELLKKGHDVHAYVRNVKRARASLPYPIEFTEWDGVSPLVGGLTGTMKGIDAVLHLAGEPIAGKRWSDRQKSRILSSRIDPAKILIEAIKNSMPTTTRPKVFISGSAVGFYGDRGDEVLTEESGPSSGFLSEICQKWEAVTQPLDALGVRRVNLRTGVVLGRGGGALKALIPLFKTGMGGPVAGGAQWMSWIHLSDMVDAIIFLLENEKALGPVNCVGPRAVTNQEFGDSLGKEFRKPACVGAPAFAVKAALGEMSEVLLSSQRVMPLQLQGLGFQFQYKTLSEALKNICDVEQLPGQKEFFFEQWVPKTIQEVFPFFSEAENLGVLTPKFLEFKILSKSTPKIEKGTLIEYQLKIHGVQVKWKTRILDWRPGGEFAEFAEFIDDQLSGPYKKWHHRHTFTKMKGGTLLTDRVLYQLPLGILGQIAMGAKVRGDVEKIFGYRRKIITERFGGVPSDDRT